MANFSQNSNVATSTRQSFIKHMKPDKKAMKEAMKMKAKKKKKMGTPDGSKTVTGKMGGGY